MFVGLDLPHLHVCPGIRVFEPQEEMDQSLLNDWEVMPLAEASTVRGQCSIFLYINSGNH